MTRPDIKTYRESWRNHWIAPASERPQFLGRNDFELRWRKKHYPVNVKKSDNLFEMEVALPGFSKEEVEVIIKDDVLTISAEKKEKKLESNSEYILKEFDQDLVTRKFLLDKGIGHEKINASFNNGVLKLTFIRVPAEEEEWYKKVIVN